MLDEGLLAGPVALPASGTWEVSIATPAFPPALGLNGIFQSYHAFVPNLGLPGAMLGTPTSATLTAKTFGP